MYIKCMEKVFELILMMFISVVFGMIMGVFVMVLWNYVMPSLGLPEITWLKAWGLTVLCDILFKAKVNINK